MVIPLAGQRVGSLGDRDPTTVLLALEMCLVVTWLKLTIVLACMQVSKSQEQMLKLCRLRWELSNIHCNNFQSRTGDIFETPATTGSSPKDVCGTSAEIPYWWRVTAQIWIVLLIGWSKFSTPRDQDLGGDTSSVSNPQTLFTRKSVMASPSVSCFLRLCDEKYQRYNPTSVFLEDLLGECACSSRPVFFVSVGVPSWSLWRYWYGRPLVDIKVYITSCCWRLWNQGYFWSQTYPRGLEWSWRTHKLQVNKKWGHVCILKKPLLREVTLRSYEQGIGVFSLQL